MTPRTVFIVFMTWVVAAVLAFVAIAALAPAPVDAAPTGGGPGSMDDAQARHLLRRTGFQPTEAEVAAIVGRPAARVVDSMIAAARSVRPRAPMPESTAERRPDEPDAQRLWRERQNQQTLRLRAWWTTEMASTHAPLAERMTLFWHNHFATSQQKVVRSDGIARQHALLRSQALGNFRRLLHEIARDPAMLVYLDGANSRKEAPNENFAREVMELFTLGEATRGGGYTEADIQQAARAFTGLGVDRDDFVFRFRPALHDAGGKRLFGRDAAYDADQALDAMLARPAAARFIVEKLWREFVSPLPDAVEVSRIAADFRATDYDIAVAMRGLLLSDAFWTDAQRGSLVKSPVELVVGVARQFGLGAEDGVAMARRSALLGQNLFAPPNVKGWPGYTAWIDASTLLERKRLAEQAFRPVAVRTAMVATPPPEPGAAATMAAASKDESRSMAPASAAENGSPAAVRFDADRFLAVYGAHADREPDAAAQSRLVAALLAVPPTQPVTTGTVGVQWLRALALDPAFQLK